jgi:diguanylate cyclase (GGDEF)-like protein
MLFRRAFRALLLSAWACFCALAPAQTSGPVRLGADPIIPLNVQSRSWLETEGRRTVDQVEAAGDTLPWRPRQPGQKDRIDHQALWIQFETVVTGDEHWFLELGSAGVDRAQLFYRDAAGSWVVQEAGDHRAVAKWPLPGRLPTFHLEHESNRPVRYWLRVEHDRVDFAASLLLLREDALLASREREQFLLGTYFGLACLIMLASLAHGLAFRDRAFLAYAAYVALLGGGQLARLGVGAQHLWPDWPAGNDTASFVLPSLSSAAALYFVKVVAEPARFSRWLDIVARALIAATLAAVALDAVMASRASLGVVLVCAVLALATCVAMIAGSWLDGRDRDIRLVALGFAPLVAFAVFPLARAFNLLPDGSLTRYGVFIGSVLEMPILYYALRVRSTRRRESELRAAALSHTDALTGLPHRRGLLQRLETSIARARSQRQNCALLAVRIANMDAIEEFGRDAAEKATVVGASHLRRAITDADMAARVSEHEFAVLLEAPVNAAAALSRAQQVVASGLRQIEALPSALTIKFHVAVAMLPHNQHGAEALLDWTLEGLQQMPADSRKLIKPLNF